MYFIIYKKLISIITILMNSFVFLRDNKQQIMKRLIGKKLIIQVLTIFKELV